MSQEIVVGKTADGNDFIVPVRDILAGRTLVVGKSGAGKSNSAGVIIEELLDLDHAVVIIDVEGEYIGLKEDFEVLHVGATEECEIRIGPEHADRLAELALEQNVPIIVDVSGYLDKEESDAVVREVARALFQMEQKLRRPFLLVVEEIHEYIPQQGSAGEVGEMLVRVAKRGRKRGLGIMGLSQRPASVDKDFITQADMIVWHRLTWKNDTQVVRDVIDAEHKEAVQTLEDGEAFVQSDWYETEVERVRFRRKRTFDAGATPDLEDVETPEFKSIDSDLLDQFDEISEEHARRRDRIGQLEQEIEEKEARINELEDELDKAQDFRRFGEALVQGAQGGQIDVGEVDAELIEEKNQTISDLREDINELETELEKITSERDRLHTEVERLEAIENRVEYAEQIEERLEAAKNAFGLDQVETRDHGTHTDDRVESLKSRIDELEKERDDLQQRLRNGRTPDLEPLESYEEFLEDPDVSAVIKEAIENERSSANAIEAIISSIIAEGGPVSYTDVAEREGYSDNSQVSRNASVLAEFGIVEKLDMEGGYHVDLNTQGMEEIRLKAEKRRKTQEIKDNISLT